MSNKVFPITPEEVQAQRLADMPGEVFEAFNQLIAQRWDGRSASIRLDEVVELVAARLDITTEEAIRRGYMDVELSYEAAGWSVVYDNPGYNETYPARFIFKKKTWS